MARQTWAALAALYPDNTAGAISPADLRAGVIDTMKPHVAASAPGASDDETLGFDIGHAWIDSSTTPRSVYECVNPATGAAVWVKRYPQDAGGVAWGAITGTLADQADLAAALSAKADSSTLGTAAAQDTSAFATAAQGSKADSAVQPGDPVSVNAQTGTTYTLVLADAGKLVTLDNGSAITLTVPTNASVAYPVGTVIAVAQLGAGTVTVQGDTGVTLNGASAGSEALSGQYATAALTQIATDTWLVTGGLA